jgi:ribonuclease P protein component
VLPASSRLSRREDFSIAVRRGRRVAGTGVVLHHRELSDEPSIRVGFIVGRPVGNAVIRNQVRRRLRHLMAARLAELPAGARVVLRATPAAATRSFAELSDTVDDLLARAYHQPVVR